MNRDLFIAIGASAGGHALFLFGIPSGDARPPPEPPPPQIITEFFEPPPEEPIEEEIIDEPQEAAASDLPPIATLAEPPPMVDVDSITQVIDRPPPPVAPTPGALSKLIPTHTNRRPGGLGGGADIFDLANLDRIPQARFQSPPVYPFAMKRSGVEGRVIVGFVVDAQGNVQSAYAMESDRHEFDAAAIEAVSKWKFRPGMKNGRPVKVRMSVPITFSLDVQS